MEGMLLERSNIAACSVCFAFWETCLVKSVRGRGRIDERRSENGMVQDVYFRFRALELRFGADLLPLLPVLPERTVSFSFLCSCG